MIVVAIVGLLAVIAIPSYVRATEATRTSSCANNLRQIDAAKTQFAMENGKKTGDAIAATDLDPYLKRGYAGVICPAGGTYNIQILGTDPDCTVYDLLTHDATL